jgi:hypothetical protein
MELDWKELGKALEVAVEGKDGDTNAFGDCANQEVSRRTLDACGSTLVGKLCCALKVFRDVGDLNDSTKLATNVDENISSGNSREHLLPDHADDPRIVALN